MSTRSDPAEARRPDRPGAPDAGGGQGGTAGRPGGAPGAEGTGRTQGPEGTLTTPGTEGTGTAAPGPEGTETAPGAGFPGGRGAAGAAAAGPSAALAHEPAAGPRHPSGDAPPPSRTLREALLVARVRTAARAGDLDEALRLLRTADAGDTWDAGDAGDVRDVRDARDTRDTRDAGDTRDTGDPADDGDVRDVGEHRDLLDLFARVHAQRGELDTAASYWRRVQTRHPDDPAAAAGLARIARLRRRGPAAALARHRTRTAVAAAVCAVAAVATGTVALVDDDRPEPVAEPAVAAERQIEQRVRKEVAAAEEAARAREAARRTAAARDLARTLRAPGVRPRLRGPSVEVAFTEGLFATGAELTPQGAARLAALGEHLTALEARIAVHGHAATVPDAPRRGGSVVALWRALIAARELSTASGKPLTAFTTASADQRQAPYEQDARNRTVTLVITPE